MSPTRARTAGTRARRARAATIGDVLEWLEQVAPPSQAPDTTPFGLQVGARATSVDGVVVAPIASAGVIAAAARFKAPLIVSVAPLLTASVAALRWDTAIGSLLVLLAQRNCSVYVPAASLAAAPDGLDDCLAGCLGVAQRRMLTAAAQERHFKLVVFVPPRHTEQVRRAAAAAGAGIIGAYTDCSYRTSGAGTFRPAAGANPTIGRVGALQNVKEDRLEVLVPESCLARVSGAVRRSHPYEEVAYDIYPLHNTGATCGRGRIGDLPRPLTLDSFIARIDQDPVLGPHNQARCSHRPEGTLRSVAVAAGQADGLYWAARSQRADVFVTGGAQLADLAVIDAEAPVLVDLGFARSVAPGLQHLATRMRQAFPNHGIDISCLA